MPKFLILLVCYHNEEEIVSFVNEVLAKQDMKDFHCMIVDNGSEDKDLLDKLASSEGIFCCSKGENLGYFGGAAYGLEYYKANFNNVFTGHVILCNTDLKFSGNEFLNKLYYRCFDGDFEILGPDIVSHLSKRHQNPYLIKRISLEKLSFFAFITYSAIIYNTYLLFYYLLKRLLASPQQGRMYCYSLHGSFLLFHRRFFERGGNLNYGSFLFGEEIFLGEQALSLQMKVLYEPDLMVIHEEHSTTRKFKNKALVNALHDSYKYILKTYY